jgi:hypothetical protein
VAILVVGEQPAPERLQRPTTPKMGGLTHNWGDRTAAYVLLFLQCCGEGHAQRIAKTFGLGLNMTQRQLKRLEEQGVLV